MNKSDIRWDDGPEWDEDRLARLERHELQTRILENNSQMLVDVMARHAPTDVIKTLTTEENMERTADCAQRYLYELCHAHEFEKVREILRHTHEYMAETIEVLEERDAERRSHPAQFHRSSP